MFLFVSYSWSVYLRVTKKVVIVWRWRPAVKWVISVSDSLIYLWLYLWTIYLFLYMLMYKQWLRGQDSVIKAQHQCSNWHVGTSKVQTRVASSWMYFFTITWNILNYYPNIWEWSSWVLGNSRGNGSSSVFSISTIASL